MSYFLHIVSFTHNIINQFKFIYFLPLLPIQDKKNLLLSPLGLKREIFSIISKIRTCQEFEDLFFIKINENSCNHIFNQCSFILADCIGTNNLKEILPCLKAGKISLKLEKSHKFLFIKILLVYQVGGQSLLFNHDILTKSCFSYIIQNK